MIAAETVHGVQFSGWQLRAIGLLMVARPMQKKFSGRTLDLDLLAYDGLVISTPVELPRSEILLNAFVLRPFC